MALHAAHRFSILALLLLVGGVGAGSASAERLDGLVDCVANVECTQVYFQTTTSTCTQAFNTQVSVFGDNTMNCTTQAKSIAE